MRPLSISARAMASAAFGLMYAAFKVDKGWWNAPNRHGERVATSRRLRGKSTRIAYAKPDHRSPRRKAAARGKQRRLRA